MISNVLLKQLSLFHSFSLETQSCFQPFWPLTLMCFIGFFMMSPSFSWFLNWPMSAWPVCLPFLCSHSASKAKAFHSIWLLLNLHLAFAEIHGISIQSNQTLLRYLNILIIPVYIYKFAFIP